MADSERRAVQLQEEVRRLKSQDQLKSEQIKLLLTKNKRLQEQLDKAKQRVSELQDQVNKIPSQPPPSSKDGLGAISEDDKATVAPAAKPPPPGISQLTPCLARPCFHTMRMGLNITTLCFVPIP